MSAKTDFEDYMRRAWPVMTTPPDVLELGRSLQVSWEESWEDRERLEFLIEMIGRQFFRAKNRQQVKVLVDAMKLMKRRLKEIPKPRLISFWD